MLLPSSCCRGSADEDAIQGAASQAGLDAAVPQMKSGFATQVHSHYHIQAASVLLHSSTVAWQGCVTVITIKAARSTGPPPFTNAHRCEALAGLADPARSYPVKARHLHMNEESHAMVRAGGGARAEGERWRAAAHCHSAGADPCAAAAAVRRGHIIAGEHVITAPRDPWRLVACTHM